MILLGEKLTLVTALGPEGKKEETSRPTVAIPSYTWQLTETKWSDSIWTISFRFTFLRLLQNSYTVKLGLSDLRNSMTPSPASWLPSKYCIPISGILCSRATFFHPPAPGIFFWSSILTVSSISVCSLKASVRYLNPRSTTNKMPFKYLTTWQTFLPF